MSSSFTTATYLISIGAAGSAATAVVRAFWTRRTDLFSSRVRRRGATRITVRVGDEQLKVEGANAADAVRILERWLADHPTKTLRSDQAAEPDNEE